jgi:CubicO group peptidase (beta-lactamase class C family)
MSRLFLFQFIFFALCAFGQSSDLSSRIDSLLQAKSTRPFNGVILITQDGRQLYSKTMGYFNLIKKTPLLFSDAFVIGSISKQITAVLVLREIELGHIDSFTSIDKFFPELKKNWPADTITIFQLLTHTHGIVSLTQPLRFKPGSQFLYSQIGYDLLAKIVEKASGKSFAKASDDLFKICGMTHSTYPDHQPSGLVVGYTEQADGSIKSAEASFENYPAAGGFISTAADLELWNKNLHERKLLNSRTYQLMISKQPNAIRDHPIFGETFYGLGLTTTVSGYTMQLGQTGFAPGYVSMNFYFPDTKTSVIVLENIAYHPADLKQTFFYHTQLLKIARETILFK